jgi:hypothetical protein
MTINAVNAVTASISSRKCRMHRLKPARNVAEKSPDCSVLVRQSSSKVPGSIRRITEIPSQAAVAKNPVAAGIRRVINKVLS